MSKTIKDFKNLHQGKRVFILASGPSLGELDLTPLQRRIVIGLNRSPLIYPGAHYHCTMDHRLFAEYPDMLRASRYLFTFEDRPFGIPIRLLGAEGFSWDLTQGIYSGYTVAYFAMQLATYMGFNELVYLGLDLKLDRGNTHFFGFDYHSENHENTEFPKMKRMLSQGAKALAEKNIKVYNCSPVADLPHFIKTTYQHALSL